MFVCLFFDKERSDESCRNKFIMLNWPGNLDYKINETVSFSDSDSRTYECPYFEPLFRDALALGYPRG